MKPQKEVTTNLTTSLRLLRIRLYIIGNFTHSEFTDNDKFDRQSQNSYYITSNYKEALGLPFYSKFHQQLIRDTS